MMLVNKGRFTSARASDVQKRTWASLSSTQKKNRLAKFQAAAKKHEASRTPAQRKAQSELAAAAKQRPLLERFMERVEKTPTCWLFTRSVGRNGYGYIAHGGRSRVITAHRAAWLLFYGDVPAGRNVLHKCDVRRCVNPEHLYVGTQSDNMIDRFRRRPFDERGAKDAPRHPVFLGIRAAEDM